MGDDVDSALEFLDPAGACHELLSNAGGALMTTLTAAVVDLVATVLHGVAANSVQVLLVRSLCAVLTKATAACHCVDHAVLLGLLDALPGTYGREEAAVRQIYMLGLAPYYALLSTAVERCALFVGSPVVCTPHRGAPLCVKPPTYATARDRLEAVVADPLLLPFLVERLQVWAMQATDRAAAPVVQRSDHLLVSVAAACPRALLDHPHIFTVLVEALIMIASSNLAATVAARRVLVATLLRVLLEVSLVDPPRSRQSANVPEALIRAYEFVAEHPSAEEALRMEEISRLVVDLFVLLAPAATQLVDSFFGLTLLTLLASQTATEAQAVVSHKALCVCLHIAHAAVAGGARRLPAILHAAGSTWRRLRDDHPDAGARTVAAALAHAAEGGAWTQRHARRGRRPRRRPLPPVPWAPATFPDRLLGVWRTPAAPRCWGCGAPWRAAEPALSPAKCSGCFVAAFCSRGCQVAAWRSGGHAVACARWARYAASRVEDEETRLARVASDGGEGAPRLSRSAAVGAVRAETCTGELASWRWLSRVASAVEAAGLHLADVIVLVDPMAGAAEVLPSAVYGGCPAAVPLAHQAGPLEQHGGRVLRVVYREHPPRSRGLGPAALGLV